MLDDEGLFDPRHFKCNDCSSFDGDFGQRTVKFIEENETQASINALTNTGDYQMLKFGKDNFIQMDYFESGNKNDGWVKVMWKVWVKPLVGDATYGNTVRKDTSLTFTPSPS